MASGGQWMLLALSTFVVYDLLDCSSWPCLGIKPQARRKSISRESHRTIACGRNPEQKR